MNTLTQHYIRKAALEFRAHNQAANVYVPEEPDYADVVSEKTRQMLIECTSQAKAEYLVNDYELILEAQAEIVSRVAEAFYAIGTRSWDAESCKDEMAALGADILRIVFLRMERVALIELERES